MTEPCSCDESLALRAEVARLTAERDGWRGLAQAWEAHDAALADLRDAPARGLAIGLPATDIEDLSK